MASDMFNQWADTLTRISLNDPTLKWVDAMCFLLGDTGARNLANAMTTNTHVTKINLRLNHIGKEGIAAIVNSLLENTSVVELNLGANDIGDEGALHVARFLEKNNSLLKLSLIRCKITSVGIKAIARSLRRNQALCWLNISDNQSGESRAGIDEIIETLRMNPNLRFLNIDSPDPDRAERVKHLCFLNFQAGKWDDNFRGTLLRLDTNDQSDRLAFLLYPNAWSKFSRLKSGLNKLFGLVRDCPDVFVYAVKNGRCVKPPLLIENIRMRCP